MWLHSLKIAQLLRIAACLHTNQSRSYLNHLVYCFFFLQDCVKYCMSVIGLFHCAESSPFCNPHYLFTLLFLSKQTSYGRKIVPSCSFCVDLVVLNVYRASNVWGDERKNSCLVLQLDYAMISNGDEQL